MNRAVILAKLRAHEAELRTCGVARLSLFGSVARDEAGPASDVDLLAAFDDNGNRLSLLDVIAIENAIADILGMPVDLIEEGTLKPRVRRNADREVVRAF